MWSNIVLGLLAISEAMAVAVASNGRDRSSHIARKRSTETVQLYAYGSEVSGLPIYAGTDNLAYIATPSATSNLTALTWIIDTTGASAWTVVANSTVSGNSSFSSGSSFYLVGTDDAFEQTGFVSNTSSVPTGGVTAGLVTYGPYVMYLENESYMSEFWATATDIDGVWAVMWNENGTAQTGSVPITIKTTAPITA